VQGQRLPNARELLLVLLKLADNTSGPVLSPRSPFQSTIFRFSSSGWLSLHPGF